MDCLSEKTKMPAENIPNVLEETAELLQENQLDDDEEKSKDTNTFALTELSKSLPISTVIRKASDKNPDKLLYHCLPITCLQLLEGIVLVASEGPTILVKMVYLQDAPHQRYQIFPSQFFISGMEFVEYPVLECGDNPADWRKICDKPYDHINVGFVWAGSVGTVIRLAWSARSGLKLLEDSNDICTNELINFGFVPVAAKWLEGGNVLVLLSVLNYVAIYERSEQCTPQFEKCFTKLNELHRIKCSKSQTLFSGTIIGISKSDIRIFAGTIFNGICIWDIKGVKGEIKHELKCHDGIIFSLQYFSEKQLLLSTSDDRTVAAWQFIEGGADAGKDEDFKLTRRFYGHDARVWKALSIRGYILSVGESSDVRVNILETGKEHKTWKAHGTAPVFTCAYDEDLEILFTGGNDGSIRKWPKWWYRLKPRILPFDVIPYDPQKDDKECVQGSGRYSGNKDYPKTVVFLDINHVIVSMESGRIIVLSWEGVQYDILYDQRCEGFQIIKISPNQKTLAIAGNDGHFYAANISASENTSTKSTILHARKIFMTKLSWNIITMIWVDVSRLLIICLNRAIVMFFNEKEDEVEVEPIQSFDLSLQRPGVPAAVEILGKHIVLGDEMGNLHMFRYHKKTQAIQKFENAHKDGITFLMFHNNILYSSGRDGFVKTFTLKFDPENDLEAEFILLASYAMPFSWVTGIYENMGQIFITGFFKEDYVIYSFNERRTLAKGSCTGGGNRKWDFKFGHRKHGSKNASFAFLKDKEILYTFFPMDAYLNVILKDGLHSRTINCAAQVPESSEFDGLHYVTGSEDGSLKWFQWDAINQKLLCIQSIEDHVSSVRAVSVVSNSSNTLLFSGGGRSHLCIYKFDFKTRRIELTKEIVLVKTTFKKIEGDIRIMDITVMKGINCPENELWCFSACSDGYVRVLYFNAVSHKFKIVALLSGNSHAVMKLQLLRCSNFINQVFICGVTSNGYAMLWKWDNQTTLGQLEKTKNVLPEKNAEYTKLLSKTAFLSIMIKASPVVNDNTDSKSSSCFTLVCGGDDCSITCWTIKVSLENNSEVFCINQNWTQSHTQRGSVVGVFIDNNRIYTVSNDQIVGFWRMNGELEKKVYAGVTDCQGFVVDTENGCVMCFGKGVSWIPIPQVL